ncbi:PD-(D/E)XK nuclease superfamily protein [compost metagenome]
MPLVTVRASSWGSLFNCAYQWEGVNLLKIRSPSSPRALLGTAIHASTAAFDVGRMLGEPVSIYDASELLVNVLRRPAEDVNWKGSDITVDEAERIGLKLHTMYCKDWSPKFEFAAIELKVKPMVLDLGGGLKLELTGTLDRARFFRGREGVGIADVKSGGAAVAQGAAKTKGHAAQIGTYELLYEHTTGNQITEDAEIIGLKTRGKPEIAMGTIQGAKAMMIGTDQFKGLIEIGGDMIRSGLFPPNPQSHLCAKAYCPRWNSCPYHE